MTTLRNVTSFVSNWEDGQLIGIDHPRSNEKRKAEDERYYVTVERSLIRRG
jgi:hypothetical protein